MESKPRRIEEVIRNASELCELKECQATAREASEKPIHQLGQKSTNRRISSSGQWYTM